MGLAAQPPNGTKLIPGQQARWAGCYNRLMLPDIQIGDRVRMRKAHPCGGYEWEVVRLGADIGLVCLTCQHRVLLSRRDLNRRMKALTHKPDNNERVQPQ